MTKYSTDISNKLEKAVVSVFTDFVTVVGKLPWFVIGATARDILVHHSRGFPVERATSDVDMGIQLSSWEEFDKLKQRLIDSNEFQPSSKIHRLIHKSGLPLDLVPFGGLQTAEEEIEWPPNSDPKMKILGFDEAIRNVEIVRIANEPELEIAVATPASIVFLKLIAFNDAPHRRGRDATDIQYIALNYSQPNPTLLFDKYPDLLDADDFDIEIAAIQILGRDIAAIVSEKTKTALETILETEIAAQDRSKLVLAMLGSLASSSHIKPTMLLKQLLLGIRFTSTKRPSQLLPKIR